MMTLKPLNFKPVLKEARLSVAVGAPPPPDPDRPGRPPCPPLLPPLSARAMAAVAAVRGGNTSEAAKSSGRRRGPHSARGVAGEVAAELPAATNRVSEPEVPAGPAMWQDGSRSSLSCEQLRLEVQALLRHVQSLGTRLAETEQQCGEKARTSAELQRAVENDGSQAEAARTELHNARQRLEIFRSVLSKASRLERGSGQDRGAGTSSPTSRRDDEVLGKLCLAGAEAERRLLLAELAKARNRSSLVAGISCGESRSEPTVALNELRSQLAARRSENQILRQQVTKLAPADSTIGGDSAGRFVPSPENVEEICRIDKESSFKPEHDVVLNISV